MMCPLITVYIITLRFAIADPAFHRQVVGFIIFHTLEAGPLRDQNLQLHLSSQICTLAEMG